MPGIILAQHIKKVSAASRHYTPYALAYKELLAIKDDETKAQEYLQKRREIEQAYIDSYYETRLQDLDIEFLLKTLPRKVWESYYSPLSRRNR